MWKRNNYFQLTHFRKSAPGLTTLISLIALKPAFILFFSYRNRFATNAAVVRTFAEEEEVVGSAFDSISNPKNVGWLVFDRNYQVSSQLFEETLVYILDVYNEWFGDAQKHEEKTNQNTEQLQVLH